MDPSNFLSPISLPPVFGLELECFCFVKPKPIILNFSRNKLFIAKANLQYADPDFIFRVPHLVYQQASFSRELQARGEVDVRCFEAPSLDCSFYSFEWINKPLSGSDRVFSVKDFSVVSGLGLNLGFLALLQVIDAHFKFSFAQNTSFKKSKPDQTYLNKITLVDP